MIAQKKITYRSKWKRSLPLFATDDRYLALLGKPGSTPLELWMDAIDDLEHDLEVRASKIRDIYARADVPPVTLETTLEEFADVLAKSTDGEWKPSSEEEVKELYDFVSLISSSSSRARSELNLLSLDPRACRRQEGRGGAQSGPKASARGRSPAEVAPFI